MKHNNIKDLTAGKIPTINMENIFNVYIDNDMLDDQYFYNMTSTVIIPDELADDYYYNYTVQGGETWTNLAYKFYGQAAGWWLICKANHILDPTSHPQPGNILKILNRKTAMQILTRVNN